MEIREIYAKTLLLPNKAPERWFNVKYNMNIYRGCQHDCIYCDSRSECYQNNFREIVVKRNAVELLGKELKNRPKEKVGTGAMSDPYMPIERKYELVRQCLEVLVQYHCPVHIITKSDLVKRDADMLRKIKDIGTSVTFTLTTTEDALGKKVEPLAPSPSARLKAMEFLASQGIEVGVTMMPILPFIEDTEENIRSIVERVREVGGKYIIPWFGMSLRDRQRAYYYEKLEQYFPGIKEKYVKAFGNDYYCNAQNQNKLYKIFGEICSKYEIKTSMEAFVPPKAQQISFFD